MEFSGPGVAELSMEERLTMANMAIEAGGKNGIFPVDEKTLAYLEKYAPKRLTAGNFRITKADDDAVYEATHVIDLSKVPLTLSFPHLPSNAKALGTFPELKIDQVVIGSCTNGRIGDMRMARSILKGRRVAKGVRCIVIPGSQKVYLQCVREGIAEDLVEAGCVFSAPTCGPCLGGHMGILASGERCVSTTNRNFVGRMGHIGSEVYLAGVPVAAASAVAGRIAGPDEIGAEGER
jgi:3-isopropylmalate/(R)-2-methylmalate dehydratase large subunit